MDLIDNHFEDYKPLSKTRGLNTLLLAAYLVSHMASSNLSFVYKDLYMHVSESQYLLWVMDVFCIVVAALLCDITGQGRILNIIGFSLMLVLCVITYSSDMLTGLPLAILFYLAQGFTGVALLQRLLRNTSFFGTTQKTILLSLAGIHLLGILFYQATRVMQDSNPNDSGTFMVALLCLAAAFVLIAVDREKDETPQSPVSQYLSEHRDFGLRFVLPLAIVALFVQWINLQPTRVYYYAVNINRDAQFQPLLSFINLILAGGLITLFLLVAKLKSQWIYIGMGTGLMLVATLMGMNIGKDDEITSLQLWILSVLTSVGSSLTFFGIMFWISRYARFPWLATLLAFHLFMENVSYLVTDYWTLYITEQNQHFTYSNF